MSICGALLGLLPLAAQKWLVNWFCRSYCDRPHPGVLQLCRASLLPTLACNGDVVVACALVMLLLLR